MFTSLIDRLEKEEILTQEEFSELIKNRTKEDEEYAAGAVILAVRELTTDPELLPLEAFLGRAEDYLRANVGVKHVTGYLATYTFDPQEKK